MSAPTKHQLLKVFSGPHVGAEVLLGDGEFVIGSDDACDVILSDQFIAPRHAKLRLDGESVQCSALDGARVFVDGHEADTVSLNPFQYFTLGNTHLALGPSDGRWPVIDFPEFQLLSAQTVEDDEDQAGAGEQDGPAGDDPKKQEGPEEQEGPATQEATENAAAEGLVAVAAEEDKGSRGWKITAAVVSAGCVCLFLLAAVLLLTPAGQDRNVALDRAAVRLAVEDVIRRHEYSQTVKVIEKSQRLTVTGYVATKKARDLLQEAIRNVDRGVRIRLWDTDGLVELARSVVRMHGVEIDVSAGKPGEVVLQGKLPDAAARSKLTRQITADVPRIATLTDRLTVEGESTAAAGGGPGAGGDAKTAAARTAAAAQSAGWAGNGVGAADRVAVGSGPWQAASGLPPIHSLNVGNTRSLTLATGQRVYPGALLESGYTVTRIEAGRVVLNRGGNQQIVKIGM